MTNDTGVRYKAFAGLRNDVAPERLASADLELADNVDLDRSGRLSRRAGFVRRCALAAHSLWATETMALFVSGSELRRLYPDHTTAVLAAVSGAPVSFCRAGDRTYYASTADSGIIEGGVPRSWGLAVPGAPTLGVASGDMPPGRYQATVTSVRADGQESGAALAAAITLISGQALRISLPALADPAVVQRNIYLSPPDGDILYHAVSLPTATTEAGVYASTVAALATPLATQFLAPAPPGQLITYYKGHMFVASGSVLYISEPFAPELFDLRNYIDLGSTITLLAPLEDKGAAGGLFVGTEANCGILAGSGPADFQYVQKADYGAISGTLAYADGALVGEGAYGARPLPLWLTTQGVCLGTPGLEIDNLTRGKFDFAASGTGAGVFMPEQHRYVASSAARTVVLRTSASPPRPGQQARAESRLTTYSGFTFNSLTAFDGRFFGADASGVHELGGATDNGALIDASVRLATTDFDSAFNKSLERLYVGYRASADLQLTVSVDEAAPVTYTLPSLRPGGEVRGSRVKVGKGLSGRYWRLELQSRLGAEFELDVLEAIPIARQRRAHA